MRQLDNVAGFLMAKGEPSHVELEQQQVEDILASVADYSAWWDGSMVKEYFLLPQTSSTRVASPETVMATVAPGPLGRRQRSARATEAGPGAAGVTSTAPASREAATRPSGSSRAK